jgi:hypothetical protein
MEGILGIELVDHVIVGRSAPTTSWVSLRASGYSA